MGEQSVGGDLFFVLMGAILVFAMHGGFAFLEVGTVRRKNQVNALVKILVDFAISTTVYFLVGYTIAYGLGFFVPASQLIDGEGYGPQGITLVRLFFLITFAAAVPAIVSGGIAERMKFLPQCVATALLVAFLYPVFEGMAWAGNYGIQDWFETTLGARFQGWLPRIRSWQWSAASWRRPSSAAAIRASFTTAPSPAWWRSARARTSCIRRGASSSALPQA
jgi:Amt family ammonium transporter